MGDEEKKKEKKKKKSKKEDDDTTILISALTCAQLKERLGDLGLKKSGSKSELVARLREADEDDWALSPTTRKSESLAAADAAAAAAATKAAAAAAAASPTATDTDALPTIVPEGRFKSYIVVGTTKYSEQNHNLKEKNSN